MYDLKFSYHLLNIPKHNVYINGRITSHIPLNLVRTSYILRKRCYFEYDNLVLRAKRFFELDSSPSAVFPQDFTFLHFSYNCCIIL